MTRINVSIGSHQPTSHTGELNRSGLRRKRQEAEGRDGEDRRPTDAGTDRGEEQGMHVVARVAALTQDEVAAETERRAEAPGDADRVQVEAVAQVEHQDQADDGQAGAEQHRQRRPLPAPRPVIADQQDGRRVLQQQGDPDGQVLHRAEVAELGAADRDDPVGHQPRRLSPVRQADPAEQHDAGHEQHGERTEDPDGDHCGRGPAEIEQRTGERTGQPEGGGRTEGDGEGPTVGAAQLLARRRCLDGSHHPLQSLAASNARHDQNAITLVTLVENLSGVNVILLMTPSSRSPRPRPW